MFWLGAVLSVTRLNSTDTNYMFIIEENVVQSHRWKEEVIPVKVCVWL